MSYSAPDSRGGRSNTLVTLLRWLLQTRERRFQRRELQRRQWIYEAQTAPTVEEYTHSR